MTDSEDRKGPDEIIHELGGCGPFQVKLGVIIHSMNIVIVWTVQLMFFVTAAPQWWCTEKFNHTYNISFGEEKCVIGNNTKCSSFKFSDDMHTVIDEWSLVCDASWIPSFMSTIQIGFQILGNFVSGHIADAFGRKIPIYMSLVLLSVLHFLSYLSVNWVMYAVLRGFLGISMGLYLTVRYSYMSEFTVASWRTWLIGIPTWATAATLFVPVVWWLKDWRKTHLTIAIIGLPFAATWWFIPESFRWYYANDEWTNAERVIEDIAITNRRPKPDMTYMKQLAMVHQEESKRNKYTVANLFRKRFLVKITLLLSLAWFTQGLVSYSIFFGIQDLAGSIYMNFFLFPLVEILPVLIQPWISNRIGRRTTAKCLFGWVALTTLTVGIIQNTEIEQKETLTRWIALAANMGIAPVWMTTQTMTVETFPTVVRNIGFGLCSVLARAGAMLGPQLAFLDSRVPGILYFCCGVVSTMSVIGLFWLPETKDSNLIDRLDEEITREQTHGTSDEERTRLRQ